MRTYPKEIEPDRFWARVNKTDGGCWVWTGARLKDKKGEPTYGVLTFRRKSLLAHRIAYFLTYGAMPNDFACHSCDNPPCCNPDHLWNGTCMDNALDRTSKGRNFPAQGEENGNARLTAKEVIAIRKSADPISVIAERYLISKNHVWQIRIKKKWGHIQ